MISSKSLKEKQFAVVPNGYSIEEVDEIITQAVSTIDAYATESEGMYHKMEVLAAKIEEYREEEDSIKSALITAQKMADKIKKESSESAAALITGSEATAKATIDDANAKAEKIVSEARDYAAKMISEKTKEADRILEDAKGKANDAINSSKIISKDILDQAKAISDDLINKSKEEKEAYDLLTAAIKNDASEFIEKLKKLYSDQLSTLESANLETSNDTQARDNVDSVKDEIDRLLEEIDEMETAIPDDIANDLADAAEESEDAGAQIEPEQPADDSNADDAADSEPADEPKVEFAVEEHSIADVDSSEDIEIIDDETADPMAAVEAFSTDEITPITDAHIIPEIREEAQMEESSLFENNNEQPFESYFKIKREDDSTDRSETISLVPPESDDDNDDEPKFKGFFKKKK